MPTHFGDLSAFFVDDSPEFVAIQKRSVGMNLALPVVQRMLEKGHEDSNGDQRPRSLAQQEKDVHDSEESA